MDRQDEYLLGPGEQLEQWPAHRRQRGDDQPVGRGNDFPKAGESFSVGSLSIGSKATLSLPNVANATIPASNSLTNGGFESPAATNSSTLPQSWTYWGTCYLSTQYAYAGAQSLVISGPDSGMEESFSVTAGKSYTLSVYAMTPAGNPLTGSMTARASALLLQFQRNAPQRVQPAEPGYHSERCQCGGRAAGGQRWQPGLEPFFHHGRGPYGAATVAVQLATYAERPTAARSISTPRSSAQRNSRTPTHRGKHFQQRDDRHRRARQDRRSGTYTQDFHRHLERPTGRHARRATSTARWPSSGAAALARNAQGRPR